MGKRKRRKRAEKAEQAAITTEDKVLVGEAASHGGMFGVVVALVAAAVGWVLVRSGRRR